MRKEIIRGMVTLLLMMSAIVSYAQALKSDLQQDKKTPVVRELEQLRTSQIMVSQVRILPKNFDGVSSLMWSADGTKLLVDRLRRHCYKIVEITVPANVRENDQLQEKMLVSWESGVGKLLHGGSPAWYPNSDRFFVYVNQAVDSRDFIGGMPWNGMHCNLFVGDCLSKLSVPLTRYRYSLVMPKGATSPRFAPDGRRLVWSGPCQKRRLGADTLWGTRSLYLGNFAWQRSVPSLTNVREITFPLFGSFYESYGFLDCGQKLLFSASRAGQSWFDMDVATHDLKTGKTRNLTLEGGGGWNRWASLSPKGQKITWSSSSNLANPNLGAGGSRWQQELRTDLWIMNTDGTEKRRLTFFNTLDTRDNRALKMTPYEHCFVGRTAWHPKGRQIAAVIFFGTRRVSNSCVVLLDLSEVGATN